MPNQYPLGMLASRVLDTPLMITQNKLNQILYVVGNRIGLELSSDHVNSMVYNAQRSEPIRSKEHKITVIPVHGTLVHRSHGLSALSGMTSYSRIRSQFREAMNDPTVESVLLDIDSPGGEVAGVFDLVDEIYNARGTKPIVAMINERGYSAAYAIASAADTIYLSRTAGVGSIGVIMLHVDRSEADKKAGLVYTPIYAGSKKTDGSPHAPLSKSAAADAQSTVDSVYSLFVATVARNNSLSESDVRDTQAATYHGQSAIDNGLADEVLSYQEVINKLKTKGGTTTMPKRKAETNTQDLVLETPTDPPVVDSPKPDDLGKLTVSSNEIVPAGKLHPTLTQADLDTAEADATTAERDRCIAIIEACNLAKTPDISLDLVCDGSSIETAHKLIMTVLAERSDSTTVISAVNPARSGATNPVLADARKRAEALKTRM